MSTKRVRLIAAGTIVAFLAGGAAAPATALAQPMSDTRPTNVPRGETPEVTAAIEIAQAEFRAAIRTANATLNAAVHAARAEIAAATTTEHAEWEAARDAYRKASQDEENILDARDVLNEARATYKKALHKAHAAHTDTLEAARDTRDDAIEAARVTRNETIRAIKNGTPPTMPPIVEDPPLPPAPESEKDIPAIVTEGGQILR